MARPIIKLREIRALRQCAEAGLSAAGAAAVTGMSYYRARYISIKYGPSHGFRFSPSREVLRVIYRDAARRSYERDVAGCAT